MLSSKRIKELEAENEELKALIQGFTSKEEKLKHFDELIKKARIEFGDISHRKDQTAQTLEALENEKARLNHDIQKISYEIKQLRELKIDERNQLLTLRNALLASGKISQNDKVNQLSVTKQNLYKEIDTAEKRKNKIITDTIELEKEYKETFNKIQEVKDVKQNLQNEIEKRKEELNILIESHNAILEEQQENLKSRISELNDEEKKISEVIRLRIKELSQEEEKLLNKISDQKSKLEEIEKKTEERNVYLQVQERDAQFTFSEKESGIKESIEQLSKEETAKKEFISELDNNISIKKSQLESLTDDYKTRTSLLNEVSDKNKQLLEEIEIKTKQLSELNQSIELSTAESTDLDNALNFLGDEFKVLSKEYQNTKSLKNDIESKIEEGAKEKKELEGYLKELRETITILVQLKNDIEQGSGMSAKRFTGVLKYYSTYISDMYKQKIHLEKILAEKERDVDELDEILAEKQNASYEIDKVLNIDQDTAEFFQELIKRIQKQWEQIKNIIPVSRDKGFAQIIQNKEVLKDNDRPNDKLTEFENTLMEMLQKSENHFTNYSKKRPVLKDEKREYGDRLNELNKNIRDSVNELSNLRSSINKIKEEHEEHRQDINKLVSIKKRLEEEIGRYQVTIDKYEKIKKQIKLEQDLIRNKRGIKEQKDQFAAVDKSKKNPNTDKFNWIKT